MPKTYQMEEETMSEDEPYRLHHKDGSLWAEGFTRDGEPHGFWQWYRKDGTRLRSGHFDRGRQIGEWTTYDKTGAVYKVTTKKG